jgi:hypothetical protein
LFTSAEDPTVNPEEERAVINVPAACDAAVKLEERYVVGIASKLFNVSEEIKNFTNTKSIAKTGNNRYLTRFTPKKL